MSLDHDTDSEPWGHRRGEGQTRWSAEETATLRRMVHANETDDAIAAALDRTVRSVAIKRHRLSLVIRKLGSSARLRAIPDDVLLREVKRRGHRVK
jgi:hypothetical protein